MQGSRNRNQHSEAGNNTICAKKGGCGQASGHATTATRPPTSSFARALWNFSSQWFLIPQGTGIIAVILHQLDYQFRGLPIISVIVWVYTIVLLVTGVFLYMLRILLYRRHVAHVLRTSIIETSCLASIPITLTTIIQMTVLVLVRQWGAAWGIVAYVLWWINTAMAVVVVMGIPYVFVKIQPPGVKAVLPGVLLPLISALTSAAGGGVICRYGALGSRLQVPVIIVSYLEVGLGLTLAITLTDIFVTRLFDQSFPAVEEIYQDMILCGPFGQASFALQILGQAVLRDAFADYDRGTFLTAEAAKPIGFASELAGLLVWGYGTFWWCFAILSISHALISRARHRQQTSYTLAAWSLVFPWGVYTNAAVELGKLMDSPAFKVWSTALLITLLVIWIVNHYFTVKGLVTGDLLGLRSRPGS